jgi:hypothetical protein
LKRSKHYIPVSYPLSVIMDMYRFIPPTEVPLLCGRQQAKDAMSGAEFANSLIMPNVERFDIIILLSRPVFDIDHGAFKY